MVKDYSQPGWAERTAFVVASGPSLTAEDCALLREHRAKDSSRVISVSNAWKLCAPWADAYYAADRRYWMSYFDPMRKAGIPLSRMWTQCSSTVDQCGVRRVRAVNKPGLGDGVLYTNSNSGAMGIGLAVLFGAKRIVLLGMDMQLGPNGLKHFDGNHPAPLVQSMCFEDWRNRLKVLSQDASKRGITILNASRATALTCFKRVGLEETLT